MKNVKISFSDWYNLCGSQKRFTELMSPDEKSERRIFTVNT